MKVKKLNVFKRRPYFRHELLGSARKLVVLYNQIRFFQWALPNHFSSPLPSHYLPYLAKNSFITSSTTFFVSSSVPTINSGVKVLKKEKNCVLNIQYKQKSLVTLHNQISIDFNLKFLSKQIHRAATSCKNVIQLFKTLHMLYS